MVLKNNIILIYGSLKIAFIHPEVIMFYVIKNIHSFIIKLWMFLVKIYIEMR